MEYDKTHKDRDDDDKKVKDRDDYEKKLGDSDGEEDRKRRMLMTVTLEAGTTMVALEARVMMKTGNASSSKGFKLSQTHQSQITMEHRWWGYERQSTNLDLEATRLQTHEVGNNEARTLRRWEWHKRMKTKIKIKETRWCETRILDWYVNDWCWIPWKGARRLQAFIHVCGLYM